MPMEKIEEESEDSPGTWKARYRHLEDEFKKEKRLRDKIERYCNDNHCGDHGSHAPDSVTWQMYRQRETEVAKLRTKIELAMNSHEEAMSMAKLQFTEELDRLQRELSTIKEPSATQQALDCARLHLVKYTSQTVLGSPFLPNEEASVSMIEANFASRKLEIELEEVHQQKTSLEFEIKRLRVRLGEETKAKETFEEQLKGAMDELDVMHKRLDEEQIARNELKRSLKAAAEELEEWKSQQSSAGPERRLSIRMQEIDDAIQRAESTSMTMERVKIQEQMLRAEINLDVSASPESGKKGLTGFALEQELQEFKIKFADSEQQLRVWKKKYEELNYVKEGLDEEVAMKKDQIRKWEKTCEELNQKLIEMEKIRHEKIALEGKIRDMTSFVERTEGLIDELEQAELDNKALRVEIRDREDQISNLEDSRLDLNQLIEQLNKQISEKDGKITDLSAENERLNITLEGIRSSFDLQGMGKSALEQKVHQLNARLVEIQGKYVNEQQEKQELRRIFRESTVGVVQLKAKVECEKIKNVDDYYGLRMQLIQRLTDTENVFTDAQHRARVELPVNQQSRRASVGLLPQPPSLPDKQDYEIMEWKGKYDEVCREIEKAEDEVKVMAAQVARQQVELEERTDELQEVTDEKAKVDEKIDDTSSEIRELKIEIEDLKEYNTKLNEDIVKLDNTIKDMEAAFEEDANAKVIEIAELKTANEDLQDALDIVSKEAAKVKKENSERASKTKEIGNEVEDLKLENEKLRDLKRDLEWKIKNQAISLEEETKAHKETDAEVLAGEKKIKELQKLLEEARNKEGDPKRMKENEQKMTDLKNKLKAEKERSEDLEDENSKMKKKLRDARTEVEEEMAAKDEEIVELKQSAKDATKQSKEMKLKLKEATDAQELAEEEVKRVEKKLKAATIKMEGLEKPDKYTPDALESHRELTRKIMDLQTALDEETDANERANDQIKELKNKLKGVKASDSELETQVKGLKTALDEEQIAHKNTNDELVLVRKTLKETRKLLDEERSGANKKKALKLQESVDEFKSALIEEKEDHAKTDNLLKEIQRELNDANKKISRLRNEVEDGQESEQDAAALQRRIKSLERSLNEEQESHEKTDQELQDTRKQLKSAMWQISDLEGQLENAAPSSKNDNEDTIALKEKVKELQDILAEEQADHEFTEKKLNKAKKDLENAKDEMMKLKKSGAGTKESNDELEEKLRELEEALEEERSNAQNADRKMKKLEQQLKEARRNIHELQETDDAKATQETRGLSAKISELQLELEEQNQTVDELNASLKDEISKKKKALSDLKALDEDKRDMEERLNKKINKLKDDMEDLRADWQDQKNLVADLETELHRADRREANAKEELEEFKKLEGLDEDNSTQGIASLRRKLENLHTALDEEMSAHEETEKELRKLEQKYEVAEKKIDELREGKSEGKKDLVKSTMTIEMKLKKMEDELDKEKEAHQETIDALTEFKKEAKVTSIKLENLKTNLPKDIVDGITAEETNEKILGLETALEEEKAAYEECLADLEGTQKKLKAVRVQLTAARAEAEGATGGGGTKYTSELKVQLKNLQTALDEEIASHEETQQNLADLKHEHNALTGEVTKLKGKPRKYSSATISLSKGLANQVDKELEELQEKNETLQKENEKFRVEIQVFRAENATLDDELNEIRIKYKAGQVTIQELKETKTELEEENEELKGFVQDLELELSEYKGSAMPSQKVVRRKSSVAPTEGPDRKQLVAENKRLKQQITDLEDELDDIKRKSRKPKMDEDEAAAMVQEMQAHLSEALMQLEAVEEILESEDSFRGELKVTLRDSAKDLDKIKVDYDDVSEGSGEQSAKWIKIQRRFGNRMSDLEDALGESQTKIKTVEKYKVKIADLTKEIRAYLDEVGGNQGMSAYKWKAKYDALLLQFERSERELAATREELASMTRAHGDVTTEMQNYRRETRLLTDRIDELLKEIEALKKKIIEMETEKRKMEREIDDFKLAIEELRNTLDEERVLAESKIAELTQMRNDLQKEVADKDEHIERITKSYERQIKDLKEDLELERQAAIDFAKHKARMTDLLAQLQAQVEVLSASNTEFSKNNRKLQIRYKEMQGLYEEERVNHDHTRQALARAEKRYRECFKQIDLLRESLERAERMKKVVTGEAEDSLHRLDTIEYKATDLESIRLRNEIEIENLRGEVEEMEAKMHIAEERSRSVTIELNEVKLNLRRYMDLESEARRGKESVEKELREVQVRLAGLEGVDVKMLKDTVRTLQRQNADLEEDLSSILHQTKGFARFEERYERRVTQLLLDLEEWKNAAEMARAENESLQLKMRKMRAQLESAETSAMGLTSRYKHAQIDVEDATERADAAVKALMYKTRGLDFIDGRVTSETVYTYKAEDGFENDSRVESRAPSRK